MSIEKKLLSVEEVASVLGVTKNTVYSWSKTGQIPHSKLGPKLVRFNPDVVETWLQSKTRGTEK